MSLKSRKIKKQRLMLEKQEQEENTRLQKAVTDAKAEYDAKVSEKLAYDEKKRMRAIDREPSVRFQWFLISLMIGYTKSFVNQTEQPDYNKLIKEYRLEGIETWLNENLPKGLTSPVSESELSELKKAMDKARQEMEN